MYAPTKKINPTFINIKNFTEFKSYKDPSQHQHTHPITFIKKSTKSILPLGFQKKKSEWNIGAIGRSISAIPIPDIWPRKLCKIVNNQKICWISLDAITRMLGEKRCKNCNTGIMKWKLVLPKTNKCFINQK